MDTTTQIDDVASSVRKSSGYRRLQGRHKALIETYENLRRDHDDLRLEHEQLETAFNELLALHQGLLEDVKTRQSRPAHAALTGYQHGG
jgi:predicted metal-dependent hydrolase